MQGEGDVTPATGAPGNCDGADEHHGGGECGLELISCETWLALQKEAINLALHASE